MGLEELSRRMSKYYETNEKEIEYTPNKAKIPTFHQGSQSNNSSPVSHPGGNNAVSMASADLGAGRTKQVDISKKKFGTGFNQTVTKPQPLPYANKVSSFMPQVGTPANVQTDTGYVTQQLPYYNNQLGVAQTYKDKAESLKAQVQEQQKAVRPWQGVSSSMAAATQTQAVPTLPKGVSTMGLPTTTVVKPIQQAVEEQKLANLKGELANAQNAGYMADYSQQWDALSARSDGDAIKRQLARMATLKESIGTDYAHNVAAMTEWQSIRGQLEKLGINAEGLSDWLQRNADVYEAAAEAKEAAEKASKSFGSGVVESAKTVGQVFGAGNGTVASAAQGIMNARNGEYRPINIYGDAFDAVRNRQVVRGTVGENIAYEVAQATGMEGAGKVAKFLYDGMMSGADSTALALLAGGVNAGIATPAMGLEVAGTATANGLASIVLGSSAASETVMDVVERGGSTEQAITAGMLAGVAEAVFEKVSIDSLLDKFKSTNATTFKKVVKNAILQGVTEATEEGATELTNIIADKYVMGSLSNIEQMKQAGMTDAQITGALAKQVGAAALAGMLMGVVGGGAASTFNRTSMSLREQRAIRALNKKYGTKVNIEDNIDGANAQYTGSEDKIDISVESRNSVAKNLAHEITHAIKAKAIDAWNSLRDVVYGNMSEDERADLEEGLLRSGYTTAELEDEVVSHYVQQCVTDISKFEELVGIDRNAAQKLVDALDQIIRKITNQRSIGSDNSQDTEDLRKALGDISLEQAQATLEEMKKALAAGGKATGEGVNKSFYLARDNGAIAQAEQMERDGATRDEIWKATGVIRDTKGNWVSELDDSAMRSDGYGNARYLNDPDFQRYNELASQGDFFSEEYKALNQKFKERERGKTLGHYIQHEELFKQFPQLRNAGVEFQDLNGGDGKYLPDSNVFILDNSLRNSAAEGNRSKTFIHEIQHALQYAEGRPGGSSLKYWERQGADNPYDMYRNTAGEIESRETANRLNMAAEERKNTTPDLGWDRAVFAEEAEKQNLVKLNKNGKPFVEIEGDILAGVPQSDWVKTIKNAFKTLYPNGIDMGFFTVRQNATSRDEFTGSKYTKTLRKQDPFLYSQKMRMVNNLDEIVQNAYGVANEDPKHPRKDDLKSFNRGYIEVRVGGKDYLAEVVTGINSYNSEIFYDIVGITPTKIMESSSQEAKGFRKEENSTKENITENPKSVNTQKSLKLSPEKIKQNADTAEQYFGTTINPKIAGYLTVNGKMLDFSGKKFGAPGYSRTMDHREITDAFEEYGDDSYSGGMVKFMSEGNIRLSPESGGINLSVKPNKVQEDQLARYIRTFGGEVIVDFDHENGDIAGSVEYPARTPASLILQEIRDYFDKGKMPENFDYSRKLNHEAFEEIAERRRAINEAKARPRVSLANQHAGQSITNKQAEAILDDADSVREMTEAGVDLSGTSSQRRKAVKGYVASIAQAETPAQPALPYNPNAPKPIPKNPAQGKFGGNTVGAAQPNPGTYANLQTEHGVVDPGENPARMIDMPKKDANGQVNSLFARTVAESESMPNEMVPEWEEAVASGAFSHEVATDKAANRHAERELGKGWDHAMRQWNAVSEGAKIATKNDLALGQLLLANAMKDGDTQTAMQLTAELCAEATRAGQAVQSFRLLKKMTPEGMLYYLQKTVNNLNEDFEGRKGFEKIKIDEGLAERLTKATTREEMDAVVDDIKKDIAAQTPVTWYDKWNAWRYVSMLGNPTTQVRNILGNALFLPVVKTKNLIATGIEAAVKKTGHLPYATKAVLNAKKDKSLLDFADKDFDNVVQEIQGGGKYSDKDDVLSKRQIFRNKFLEGWRTLTNKAMDKGDEIFSHQHYKASLAQYMKANNLTPENITPEQLNKARSYAVQEAQRATYRDASSVASLINRAKRTLANTANNKDNDLSKRAAARAGEFLLEGFVPFTKTPVNIVKRGIEYSPVGLVHGTVNLVRSVRGGDVDAAAAIDRMAAGLTGSGLLALGAWLASLGMVSGGPGEDDREEKYKGMLGGQDYALDLGDSTYTIDWLAPEALPFFTGVELYKEMQSKDGITLADTMGLISAMSDPIVELSMLSSMNNTFESLKYTQGDALSAVAGNLITSYLGQGVPTVGGKIARTLDETSRQTYYDPNKTGIIKSADVFRQKVQTKIPGAANALPERVDLWGRTEKNTGGNIAGRFFYNMLSPGYAEPKNVTKVDEELLRLAEATSDSNVYPEAAAKTFKVSGETIKLNSKQYTQFAKTKGQTAFDILEAAVDSSTYKKMTDAEKAEFVKDVYEYANAKAKAEVSKYQLDGKNAKIAQAEAKGIKPVQFLTITGAYDKDGNGSVTQEEAKEVLDKSGLTKAQKAYLWKLQNKSWKNNPYN